MPKFQTERFIQGWGEVRYPVARAVGWAIVLVNGAIGVFLIVGGVDLVLSGSSTLLEVLVVEFCGAFFVAMAAFYFLAVLWRPRPAADGLSPAEGGPAGIVIPIRRPMDVASIVGLAAATGATVGGAVATTGGWRVVLVVAALPFAVLLVPFLWTWPMTRRMVISTAGLLVEDGVQSAYLAWDDISEISWGAGGEMDFVYTVHGRPVAPSWHCRRRSIRFRPERAEIRVRTVRIDLDPLLLGWALMTYRLYPELREELVTGVARSRLLDPGCAYATTPSAISALPPFPLYRPRWLTAP